MLFKIAISFFTIGLLGMLHQRLLTGGGWFNWSQFWHHEPLIAVAFALGAGVLLAEVLRRVRC